MTANGEHNYGRWRIVVWGGAALLVVLALAATQLSGAINANVENFAFAGAVLFAVGIVYELAVRTAARYAYRAAVLVALAAAFILVWGNAALGVIGSENNQANLLYVAVVAVAFIGAIIARFQPRGMARAMFAAALAQALVPVIALAAGWASAAQIVNVDVPGLTVFFSALFVASGWLFQRAAREGSERAPV